MKPIVVVAALALLVSLVSCKSGESTGQFCDRLLFQHFGVTVFHKPTLVPMKEVHLESGRLSGKELLVKGVILEMGKNGTYFVISDQTARLLVVLTELEDAGVALKNQRPRMVQIIGTVQSGKKGLPYLKASSMNILQTRRQS